MSVNSWSRPPEVRAIHLDQRMRAWVRWLCRCNVPLDHIAIVLDVDLAAVDDCVRRTTRDTQPPCVPTTDLPTLSRDGRLQRGHPASVPTPPPRIWRDCRRMIVGQTAIKVRRLDALRYPPSAIAVILDVRKAAVEDLLRRCVPRRGTSLTRPRSRPEQARLKPPRRRPEPPAAPPPIDPADAWRYTDGPSPFDPPPVVPAAVAELDQVVVDVEAPPPPARNEWVGSASLTPGGKSKFTDDQAAELQRERAAGATLFELAAKYRVARNTISAALKRTIPPPPLPSFEGDCPENGQNPRENGQ
jgi:hypothetical protein